MIHFMASSLALVNHQCIIRDKVRMYSFEGEFRRRPQQSLGGASRKERRDELLQRATNERQKREESRRRTQGAICIQSFVRGTLTRLKLCEAERQKFDLLQQQQVSTNVDENTCEKLLKSLLFFYQETKDVTRLLWLSQHVLRKANFFANLVCAQDGAWKHRIKKLLHILLRYLVGIAHENSPIALPMRLIEIFTSVDTFVSITGDVNQVNHLLIQIFSFLVKNGFFKHVYLLINAKVPDSLEKSPHPPTPLSGSIFNILMRPVRLINNVPNETFSNQTLQAFCREFFLQPFTEQLSCFVMPALIQGNVQTFPFAALLKALVSSDRAVTGSSLSVQPTPWLLYSILQMVSHFAASLMSSSVGDYLQILQCLTPTIHCIEKDEVNYSSDSEDEVAQHEMTSSVNEELQIVIRDSINLINEPWHVHLLLTAVEQDSSSWSLKCLCCICHDLLMHQKLSVFKYRLLYTLAFKQKFLKDLWQTIISASNVSVFGSKTPLLQMLARGMLMRAEDQEEIIPLLSLFCSLFSYLLLTLHDAELYGDSSAVIQSSPMPFTVIEVVMMSLALRDVCLGLIELAFPDTRPSIREDYRNAVNSVSNINLFSSSSSSTAINEHAMRMWSHLFKVVVNLVQQLYNRDTRQALCPKGHWISQKVHIPTGKTLELNFRRGRLKIYKPFCTNRTFNKEMLDEGPPLSVTEIRNLTILREIPFVVPFTDRVVILQQLIAKNKTDNQSEMVNFLSGPQIQVLIRRNYIYEDAFDKLSYDNEPNLKLKMRIQLVNAVGLDEAGIDGGGIFREFLSELLKTAFDPNRGFFRMTHDNLLYPNPNVHLLVDNPAMHYYFIGRMLGKALYENMLVELPLAGFFLTKLLGHHSGNVDIHHLDSLDPVMYRNLLYLKHYEGDVSELGLDFTVTNNELGETQVEELKPNGANTAVTAANCIEYIHLVADYKLNKQIRAQCEAFRQGLANLVNIEWLQMFDARELQVLISGASIPVDLQDLKQHTNYSGGFSADHPVIKIFWKVVDSMDDRQRRQLLKFVTSCSRPPLLGFKELYPALCIQNAGADDRLPTASTCMNLLKLPEFYDENVMKAKLLYAIESCSGFELS